MWKQLTILIVFSGLLLPFNVEAQPPDPLPLIGQAPCAPKAAFAQRHGPRRSDMRAKIRTMKIWKLTEELDLSEEQAARFFPLLNKMEDQQDDLRDRINETMDLLAKRVWDPEASAKEINDLIDKIESYQEEEQQLRKQFRKDAAKVLNPAQMGKLIIFNTRFPQILREMMQDL
jgi:Spy/CpxP family protein refolding chaperone